MTVGVAWIRAASRGNELWFASDSRLSGNGRIWDDCPKLVVLPRRDMAAGFSGTTAEAYPLLLQLANAISGYRLAADGTLELTALIEHLDRVVNDMLDRLRGDPGVRGAADPRAFATRGDVIVLGGWSRHVDGLVIRALQFDRESVRWKFTRVRARSKVGPGKVFRVYGDRAAAPRYDYLLQRLLDQRGKLGTSRAFDLEPLEVLWDFLRMPESSDRPLPANRRPPSIGGVPQVVQVLPGGRATPFAIRWGDGDLQHDYLLGRRCLGYENLDVPLLAVDAHSRELLIHARGQWSRTQAS